MGKREEKPNLEENLIKACDGYMAYDIAINPISEIDGKIYLEIVQIVEKLGGDKNLMLLLNSYKEMSDNNMLDLMKSYNDSLEPTLKHIKYFVTLKDFTCDVESLFSFSKHTTYNKGTKYLIIINKTQNLKVPYANIEITYNSENERNMEWNILKQKLVDFNNVKFL